MTGHGHARRSILEDLPGTVLIMVAIAIWLQDEMVPRWAPGRPESKRQGNSHCGRAPARDKIIEVDHWIRDVGHRWIRIHCARARIGNPGPTRTRWVGGSGSQIFDAAMM